MTNESRYAPFFRLLPGIPHTQEGHTPYFPLLVRRLLQWAQEKELLGGMTKDEIDLAASLSVYHDIGKSMLRPTLLYKQRLSPQEYDEIKLHTAWGEFLMDLAIPELRGTTIHRFACEICRYHHERWDGGGYPDGLRGWEIPGYVQVIGLADAYDALVAPRSYKRPLSHQMASNMIVRGDCGAFCAPLLMAFAEHAPVIQSEVYENFPAAQE